MKIFVFDLDGTIIKRDYADYFWYFVVPYIISRKRKISIEKAIRFCIEAYFGEIPGYPKPSEREWHYLRPWFERFFGIKENFLEFLKKEFEGFEEKIQIHFSFEDGFLEIIKDIRKNHKTILLSNIDLLFYNMFKKDIKDFFDEVYLTHKENKDKKEILAKIIEKEEINPRNIIIISDSFYDMKTSQILGVTGILYDKLGIYDYRPKIKSLYELRSWI